ncbi:MAG TPA: hypothetical protein VGQ33_21205 [Vicinamibacteria bacterium]|nr:hypothetical protein [Vicinamibacteria bacterium]
MAENAITLKVKGWRARDDARDVRRWDAPIPIPNARDQRAGRGAVGRTGE